MLREQCHYASNIKLKASINQLFTIRVDDYAINLFDNYSIIVILP